MKQPPKTKKCQLCGTEFVICTVINGKRANLQNRKYCLSCSPYKEHNTLRLETPRQLNENRSRRTCSKCHKEKCADDFFVRNRKQDGVCLSSWCRQCSCQNTLDRQRNLKREAVEYLGGKCKKCGIVGHPAIYDFHHRNPEEKDLRLSSISRKSVDSIKGELDKCDLLCAICHRLEHTNYV